MLPGQHVADLAAADTLGASGGFPPYTWAGSPPFGLSLNASTGTISGAPNAEGTKSFTVTLSDTTGAKVTASLALSVTAPAMSLTWSPPQINRHSAGFRDAHRLPLQGSFT